MKFCLSLRMCAGTVSSTTCGRVGFPLVPTLTYTNNLHLVNNFFAEHNIILVLGMLQRLKSFLRKEMKPEFLQSKGNISNIIRTLTSQSLRQSEFRSEFDSSKLREIRWNRRKNLCTLPLV